MPQVEFDGSTIGKDEMNILNYFFASEIRWACDSQSVTWLKDQDLIHFITAHSVIAVSSGYSTEVGMLKVKPLIYLLISLLLAVPGVLLTVEGWELLGWASGAWRDWLALLKPPRLNESMVSQPLYSSIAVLMIPYLTLRHEHINFKGWADRLSFWSMNFSNASPVLSQAGKPYQTVTALGRRCLEVKPFVRWFFSWRGQTITINNPFLSPLISYITLIHKIY